MRWRFSPVAKLELYGTRSCPYTREMREWLEFRGTEFVEFDVDGDREARKRIRSLANGQRTVPILVEDGKISQIGWQGRGCVLPGD
jgi:glutaredoxin 3